MKRKTGLIVWLVVGILLALGPLWGMIGTLVGMVGAFQKLGHEAVGQGDALASDIRLALWATASGWIACPIGAVIIALSAIKLARAGNEPQEIVHAFESTS